MASFFSDPQNLVAVDLQNWLDKDPARNLNFDQWKDKGKMQMVREGIDSESYEWIMKHGFPHVRGIINKLRKQYHDAPQREHEKELQVFMEDYQKMQERSTKDNQRRMIIFMKMRNQSLHDISMVIGKSETFVDCEAKRMEAEGWCGE